MHIARSTAGDDGENFVAIYSVRKCTQTNFAGVVDIQVCRSACIHSGHTRKL